VSADLVPRVETARLVLRGYGSWAVERKSDGVLLGRAGLWNPDGRPGLEVGWKLARLHGATVRVRGGPDRDRHGACSVRRGSSR
jgi:hypothetical protein